MKRIIIKWNTWGGIIIILLLRTTFNPSPIPIKWLTRSATPTNLSHIFQHNALSTNLWCLSNYNDRHNSIPYTNSYWQFCHYIPYRTKLFIGINVREIRDCQNCKNLNPLKVISNRCSLPENNTEEWLTVFKCPLGQMRWVKIGQFWQPTVDQNSVFGTFTKYNIAYGLHKVQINSLWNVLV